MDLNVVKEKISQFLSSVETRGVSCACVYGPRARGKSTTMVAYILRVVRHEIPSANVLYLLPTAVEAAFLVSQYSHPQFGIADHVIPKKHGDPLPEDEPPPPGTLTVLHYDHVLAHANVVGDKAVVLLDLEAEPTTEGEVLLGRLLGWARHLKKKSSAFAIVTISPFRSPSTEEILQRVTGRVPKLVAIAAEAPVVPITTIEGEWQPAVRGWVDAVFRKNQGRVIVGESGEDGVVYPLSVDATRLDGMTVYQPEISFLNSLQMDPVLEVNPLMGFSIALPGLRYFLSRGVVLDKKLDRGTSQIVEYGRDMTQTEIRTQQSWLLKSGTPLGDVKFLAAYDEASFASRPHGEDPIGRAYGGDLMWTVLTLIQEWPSTGTNEFPVRHFPDIYAVREAVRRLRVVGCVEVTGMNLGELTEMGRQVLNLKQRYKGRLDLDFHAAYLLASVFVQDGVSANVKRVIIRLASISAHNIDSLCWKVAGSVGSPSIDSIKAVCRGIGGRLAHKGALWIALGLYQAEVAAGHLSHGVDTQVAVINPVEWLGVNPGAMFSVKTMVRELEDRAGILATQELVQTELTDDEILLVETRLMWAYLHRTALFDPNVEQSPVDLTSLRTLSVSSNDILDINHVRLATENQGSAVIAIYHQMNLSADESRKIKNLTIFPRRLVREVEKEIGKPIQAAMATTYPLVP